VTFGNTANNLLPGTVIYYNVSGTEYQAVGSVNRASSAEITGNATTAPVPGDTYYVNIQNWATTLRETISTDLYIRDLAAVPGATPAYTSIGSFNF
jgi:hypothetical protein